MELDLVCRKFQNLDLNSITQYPLASSLFEINFICQLFEGLSISDPGVLSVLAKADLSLPRTVSVYQSGDRSQDPVNGRVNGQEKGQVISRPQHVKIPSSLVGVFCGFLWVSAFKDLTKFQPGISQRYLLLTRASCNALLTINFLDLLLVSHQVKLDFYLFSREKIGMISLSFMEDVGKSFIDTEDYFSWNYLKDHFDNVLPLYLVYQFKHLDPYTSVQITLLLDIPRRQTFKPGFTGNGAWAVSTYTWYKSGLYCVDGLKGIGWMLEEFSVCSWQVFDISFTKFFFSDLLDPFSNLVVYWVVSCLLVECILTSRPRSPLSSMKAWEVFLYTRKCVCEWIVSAIGKLIKILMFGGSWFSLVSHSSSSRGSDALIVCEALCRKHIHVLKGSLMVVPVPHDRSGSDEGRAVSYVSSLVLDRLSNNFMSSWRHSLARHLIRLYYYYLNYCNFYFLGLGCYFVLVRPPVWCLPTVMA